MKAFIIFLLLVIGAIAFYLFGPMGSSPQPAQTPPQQQQQQQQQTQKPQATTTIREDIDSAMGYGVGYTQMKVKKKSQEKLDKISGAHNQKIEGMK